MFDRIIRFSLKNRLLVLSAAALLLVYGAWVIIELPIDVFPDLNRPTITILTETGGLAPEEVETLVVLPMEIGINGIPGLTRIRSVSTVGVASIYLEFDWGTDIYRSRQLVAERLALIRDQLPKNVTPIMGPVSSVMGEIQMVGLTSEDEKISQMDLRSTADWVVRPRLLSIPGIAQVIAMGGGVRQYQVMISAEELKKRNLSLEQVERNLAHISENTTGGFIFDGKRELLIRNLARVKSIEEIEDTAIATSLGRPVLAKDIAKIKFGPKNKRGDGSIMAKPGVLLTVQKQPGTSTIELTKTIAKTLDEIQATLPKGMKLHGELFNQANFIEHSIHNVKEALRDGAILVTVVLFLFLLNFRTTAITLTAIPLSFVLTAIVFKLFGLNINTMTLGGLAVAIGELVDDAIVDVENVFRRLNENRHSPTPKPATQVIFEASSEVRNSIVFATIIVVLVFIPLFAMGGLEGKFFAPLGIAYVVSLVASLFVSLTVTPALCSYLLPSMKGGEHGQDGLLVRSLKKWDERILRRALVRPKILLGIALLLLMGSLSLVPLMGKEFLPKFNEGTALVAVRLPPGVNIEESGRITTQIEKLILSIPEVASLARRTGRGELDEFMEGVNHNEIYVEFKAEGRKRDIVLDEIRDRIQKQFPEVLLTLNQPISERLDFLLSGVKAQIAIKVFGPDIGKLRAAAGQIYSAIDEVKGLVDLQMEQQVPIPQVKIKIFRDKLVNFNILPGELTHLLELGLEGEETSSVLEGQRSYEIFLRLDEESRRSLYRMKKIPIKVMPDGRTVTLSDVADVYESVGPNTINRENAQRRVVVQANVHGRDLNSVIEEIRDRISKTVKLPAGYYITYGGQFESQQKAAKLMMMLGALSILGIFLVLYGHFRSSFIAVQIMLNIPMALIGSLIGVFVTDRTISIASMVAFVTLCGIASRNGIMMISHYLHLMEHEKKPFSIDMVIQGSLERLVPVLMTALTAMLALIPLLLSKGAPGKEILYPVAVVIFGGLFSSTLLDIWVTPTVFYNFGRKSSERAIRRNADAELENSHEVVVAPLIPQGA